MSSPVATADRVLRSTNDKPTNVAFRQDIQWTMHQDQKRWVARDPLNGRFFYFSHIEHVAAGMLDGQRSLSALSVELITRFPQHNLTEKWLLTLVSRLNAAQLLLPASRQAVSQLLRQRQRASQRGWLQMLLSPLSIRIPLINPHPWLKLCRPLASVLFSRFTLFFVIVFGLIANLSVLAKILATPNSLTLDLSAIHGVRWLWLLVCYVLVKSLHELGHGLACVYLGTRCSELGVLFLFFTPCLYCDTTDAWKLSSRWQRAAIGAAGMYVELILASIAAVTWLATQDGLLHSLAANTMLICSVGTLLINGNPFLRYDGYYILSDVWGVPNLADQAREATMILFTRVMTGKRTNTSHLDRPVGILAAYHVVAVVYRTFIMLMILWLAWTMLVPLGLGFLALLVIGGTMVGLMIAAARLVKQIHLQVLANETFKVMRWLTLFVGLLLALVFVAQVNLPVLVRARGVTDFSDKQPVFATDDAILLDAAAVGQTLPVDSTLLKFDSPEKRYELQLVEGEIASLSKKIEYLNQAAGIDPTSRFELPFTLELLAERRSRAQSLQKELSLLTQTTSSSGRLLPASFRLNQPLAAPTDLQLQGGPLDEVSRGCMLERGTLIGWFSNQEQMEVVTLVSQQDIKQLRLGLLAACQWDCDVHRVARGTIVRIAPDPIEQTPDELVGDSGLMSARNAAGKFAPTEPHYAVTIRMDQPIPKQLKGSLVTVQVHVNSQPLLVTVLHAIRLSLKPL
ncbi:MAG: hypothetical protein IT423_18855 [Pirellulaceae bacterium]|nr:hypothetical protein [Pirellulaceae bacterium]